MSDPSLLAGPAADLAGAICEIASRDVPTGCPEVRGGDSLCGHLARNLHDAGYRYLAPADRFTVDEDDDGHGPWFDLGGVVLCSCRYPVDTDERCTRPRTPRAEQDALTGTLFEAVGALLARFDRGPDTVDCDESPVADLQAAYDELAAWGARRAEALAAAASSGG